MTRRKLFFESILIENEGGKNPLQKKDLTTCLRKEYHLRINTEMKKNKHKHEERKQSII
jgi:hypothetical protein